MSIWTYCLGPAAMSFCEAPLAGFPVHPADTWTNAGPLLAGLWILRRARRDGQAWLKPLGWVGVALALGSAAFHGTDTRLGEWADLWAMLAYAGVYGFLSWRRLAPGDLRRGAAVAAVTTIATGALSVADVDLGIPLFTALVAALVGLEAYLVRRLRPRDRRPLVLVVVAFAAALAAWLLDYHRVVCDPHNHVLTLHGVWHLLNALPLAGLYLHLRQFGRRP